MCWLPLILLFACVLFLTVRTKAGEGMTPRIRGQPAEGIQECENSGLGMTANLSHRAPPICGKMFCWIQ